MTNIVTLTIVLGSAIFSAAAFNNRTIFEKYLFNAYAIKHHKQWYRFISHGFIHANWPHLILNMFVLYSFGKSLEMVLFPALFGKFSNLFYILLYTGALFAASIAEYFKNKDNPSYSSVGASGAVNAIVFSFIVINPGAGMGMIFIPIAIPAWIFGLLFLAYSFYMNKRNTDNIGHGAHAWGAIFGFLFTGLLKPELFTVFFYTIFHPHFN